jgi:hypothetical protein
MVYRGKILFYRKNYGSLRTGILRLMFGVLSAVKMLFWCLVLSVPSGRRRAKQELQSNIEVVRLSLKVEWREHGRFQVVLISPDAPKRT